MITFTRFDCDSLRVLRFKINFSRALCAGLRIDLSLVNTFTGETQWIDVTSVNTAAPSYASRDTLSARQTASCVRCGEPLHPFSHLQP